MVKRGCLPPLLLGALCVLALLVAGVAALSALGCCAIDCAAHPEACAANERRQQSALLALLAALAVAVGSFAGAVRLWRRR